MFAKPAPKKTPAQGSKQKVLSKAKTVSVKTGVKTPQTSKKCKTDGKVVKVKPPPRPDAGYSLYSTDSEDQVATAFDEMEACEKIITHLKYKQKSTGKAKTKVKKKNKEESSPPKALNENPPLTNIVPGISSLYGTPFPYGAAHFLRQLQSQDYATNPIFNSRLASSTPDPEKLVSDMSASKLPNTSDLVTQDIPERDISAVSSVPPSFNHLQNMAEMVEIYQRLEINKASQIQEAAAKETLQKLNAMEIHQASKDPHQGQIGDLEKGHGQFEFNQGQGIDSFETVPNRDSGGFVRTGSLGFSLEQGESVFRPLLPLSSDMNADYDNRQGSSLTAFQPYLSTDSNDILPPQNWIKDFPAQGNAPSDLQGQGHHVQFTQQQDIVYEEENSEVPNTGRTDKSDGTDYVRLPRSEVTNQTQGDPQGSRSATETRRDANIVYEKQNGLYQIHRKTSEHSSSISTDSKSGHSEVTGQGHGQGSLDEIPERDMPSVSVKTNTSTPHVPSSSSKEGTFRIDGQKNDSQNLSGLTASTSRNPNTSVTSGASSLGGKIVFIPNDSNTPNVIGYVPGIPVIPGANQPMSWPVTQDIGNVNQPGSVVSSILTPQGASSSQLTAHSGLPGARDASGSGYHSVANARTIAAGDVGSRKLRYLLKELKECNKVTGDVEVSRLVTELDETVNAIPQLALTFNLQTEIDLAIQPLRSENSQLRRKLRLINQQLKEKELAGEQKDINFEILHLQTSNETLQKVIREEKDIKTRLAAEVQYLYQEIHKMKIEKSRLIAQTSEKETEQLKVRQEMTLETQAIRHDLDLVKKSHEVTVNKLESIEKENHILQITLQQRDDEIARQQEIVETMKEGIADLLHELDQSRTGDRAWDQNQSYGLHRLMKIVEEDNASVFTNEREKAQTKRKVVKSPHRKSRTPERRHFDFDSSGGTASTTKLTKAALAYHDRKHGPAVGRMGPDGRQGPASESELDTLVEMHLRGQNLLPDFKGQLKPGHRRHSSSSPVRFKNDIVVNLRHQRTATSPVKKDRNFRDTGGNIGHFDRNNYYRERERTIGQDSDDEQELSPSRRPNTSPYRRAPQRFEEYSPSHRRVTGIDFTRQNRGNVGHNLPDGTEVSVEQSRYSVTDYFNKYHPCDAPTQPKEAFIDTSRPPMGRFKDVINRQIPQFHTSSEIDERTVKSSEANGVRNAHRLARFKGGNDQTVSAIHDDDNVSSVSMSTANTVDDRKFRSGIATLDANIARLQQALQKTKSMLN